MKPPIGGVSPPVSDTTPLSSKNTNGVVSPCRKRRAAATERTPSTARPSRCRAPATVSARAEMLAMAAPTPTPITCGQPPSRPGVRRRTRSPPRRRSEGCQREQVKSALGHRSGIGGEPQARTGRSTLRVNGRYQQSCGFRSPVSVGMAAHRLRPGTPAGRAGRDPGRRSCSPSGSTPHVSEHDRRAGGAPRRDGGRLPLPVQPGRSNAHGPDRDRRLRRASRRPDRDRRRRRGRSCGDGRGPRDRRPSHVEDARGR